MTVYEFYKFLDKIYPKELSCPWDNDGIMCSRDPDASVRKVLVSLDATERALKYASEGEFDLLLTHHPMIFRKLEAVTPATLGGNRAVAACGGDISVISLHTRLDAGRGGVNDSLVEKLGYTSSETFGDDESLELGRIFELESPIGAEAFSLSVKEKLGAQAVRLTGCKAVKRIAVVGGAGGDFVLPAILSGADMLLCGECSYNAAQDAAEQGLCVLEAGHYHTEFPVCRRLLSLAEECGISGEIFESCDHITL